MKGHVMAEKDLGELFLHTLKDVYFAEHEILKTLPKMSQAAKNGRLKQAFDQHRVQTEGQIQRLQQVFSILDQKAEGAPCEAIKGILAEGSEVMEEFAGGPALDASLIAAAQAVEHYEIARYGALCSWAELVDLGGVETLLEETLDEEKETDLLLTQLAEEAINIKSA
jgi:ferritin-like metal-binding protein YciE